MKLRYLIFIFFFTLSIQATAHAEKKIAVLPFEVPADKKEMKQFGIGTMDTLTYALSNIHDFIMIDRSQLQAVMKENALQHSGFVDDKESVKLGKLLGAEILVLGSIQAFENKYRIVARFTDVQTGKILGISQVTGTDIFDLQDKLALEIVKNQNIVVTDIQKEKISSVTKATADLKAYEYYTKGRTSYLLFTRSGYQEAIKDFDLALVSDKNYTRALIAKLETQALWAMDLQQNQENADILLEQIENTLNTLLKKDATQQEAYRALSMVYLIQKKYEEAKIAAQKALDLNINDPESNFMLWMSSVTKYGNASSLDPDSPLIKKAIELNPYLVMARFIHGLSYMSKKRLTEAENEFRIAIKYSPESSPAHLGLSMIYVVNNDLVSAIKEAKEAVKFNPTNPSFYRNIGDIYYMSEKYNEALYAYNSSYKLGGSYESLLKMGNAYFGLGKFDEAVNQYNQVLNDKNPPSLFYALQAVFQIGKVYQRVGNVDKAIEQFNKVLKVKSLYLEDDKDPYFKTCKEIFANTYFYLGEDYKLKNNLINAIASYKEALNISPEHLKAKTNLSGIYYIQGLNNYNQGKYAEAISFYTESIRLRPDNSDFHNNLGIVFYSQNKIEQSIQEYQQAIKIDQKNANAHTNLGLVFEKQGNLVQANEEYKKACELGMVATCQWVKVKN